MVRTGLRRGDMWVGAVEGEITARMLLEGAGDVPEDAPSEVREREISSGTAAGDRSSEVSVSDEGPAPIVVAEMAPAVPQALDVPPELAVDVFEFAPVDARPLPVDPAGANAALLDQADLDVPPLISRPAPTAEADATAGPASSVEIIGSAGADTLTGGDGDDVLWGDANDDWIEGGGGNDRIDGGAGGDMIIGDAATSTDLIDWGNWIDFQ